MTTGSLFDSLFIGKKCFCSALEAGHKELKQNKRPGVPQLIVLLTDGEQTANGDPEKAADVIKKDGIEIFSVGVTNLINKNQLEVYFCKLIQKEAKF